MTVISEPITTPTGEPDNSRWMFARVVPLSEDDDGLGVVTDVDVYVVPVGGVLTTPDLEPGDYVAHSQGRAYPITVPDSATPIRLWPLIATGTTPPDPAANWVRNFGGVAGARRVTESQYAALIPDDDVLYVVVAD